LSFPPRSGQDLRRSTQRYAKCEIERSLDMGRTHLWKPIWTHSHILMHPARARRLRHPPQGLHLRLQSIRMSKQR
jgi:hypothetical protein